MNNPIPETGFLRLPQIIGDPKKNIPPIIPVKKSTWWKGCINGQFPAPIKLSPRVTVWRAEDIRALVASFQPQENK
jgi:prophage regulatory protein